MGGRFSFFVDEMQNLRIWEDDFFEFLFLLKNLGVVEERESRALALSLSLSLSLSLLRDDTSIRCEEQLIKH